MQDLRSAGNADIYAQCDEICREEESKVVARYVVGRILGSILEGQTVGEGIKRTPAYETSLTEEQVLSKREEFWSKGQHARVDTRVQGDPTTWQLLKLICESDPRIRPSYP